MIEKAIHAFALLCILVQRGIPLVFKGGTSLWLRLPRPRRLSIDLDIVCPIQDADLNRHLAEVGKTRPFLRHEENLRGPDRLPARRHFKFFYRPLDRNNPAPFVMLDVVRTDFNHPHVREVSIQSQLFEMEQELQVGVPTIESLLADKLTAFAPNTVGVPFISGLEIRVVKQLFDVSALFDVTTDFSDVIPAYDALFRQENGYRGGRFTREGALSDTVETARVLCHHDLKGGQPHDHGPLLEKGRKALGSHLIVGSFSVAEAKVAASKAAALASCLRDGRVSRLASDSRYDSTKVEALRNVRLSDLVLERLKGGNPEAYYYWALALGEL